MIDHIWSVLCSRSVIDSDTNNVSIQDVIEQITVNAEPTPDGFLPVPMEVITLWGRKEADKPDQGMERVIFVTPSGRTTIISESKIDLSVAERHRQRTRFPGLPINEAGRHYFKVETKNGEMWRDVAALPLTVVFQPRKK